MGSENRKTAEKNTKLPQNRIEISQIGKNRTPPNLVKPQYHRYKIKIPAKLHQKATQYRITANPYVTLLPERYPRVIQQNAGYKRYANPLP